jgi:hypothetical protein
MKTLIIAGVAALGLGVGAAYAQGVPAGFHEQVYGSQAFADHHNETATHFLGQGTVLGKIFSRSSSGQVAAATSAKGG